MKKKFIAKLVLLGDGAVGKTSLKRRLTEGKFDPNQDMTIGADFARVPIEISEDYEIILQVWDIAGQMKFSNITSNYYKGAKGAILVFDVTRYETYQNLFNWLQKLDQELDHQKVPLMIIGNKIDLVDQQVVTEDLVKEYCEQLSNWLGMKVPYAFTSAKTGQNVEKSFFIMGNNMLDQLLQRL